MEINKIFNEDCLVTMDRMEDGFVDLTVTSPPYDNLRTYDKEIDVSWGDNIWKPIITSLFRVTKQGGVVVWVVADATINGSETGTSFRQALYAMDVGFRLHDTMIYAKNNPIPLSHNRYEQQFEYMFVWSKGKPKTFNPIKVKTKNAGKVYNFNCENDYGPRSAKRKRNENIIIKDEKNKFNIWFMNVANTRITNSAPFPEKLANDHIISWSNKGDIVYDPFMGSGTTAKMALINNRNFIGSEINEKYCKLAKGRISHLLNINMIFKGEE